MLPLQRSTRLSTNRLLRRRLVDPLRPDAGRRLRNLAFRVATAERAFAAPTAAGERDPVQQFLGAELGLEAVHRLRRARERGVSPWRGDQFGLRLWLGCLATAAAVAWAAAPKVVDDCVAPAWRVAEAWVDGGLGKEAEAAWAVLTPMLNCFGALCVAFYGVVTLGVGVLGWQYPLMAFAVFGGHSGDHFAGMPSDTVMHTLKAVILMLFDPLCFLLVENPIVGALGLSRGLLAHATLCFQNSSSSSSPRCVSESTAAVAHPSSLASALSWMDFKEFLTAFFLQVALFLVSLRLDDAAQRARTGQGAATTVSGVYKLLSMAAVFLAYPLDFITEATEEAQIDTFGKLGLVLGNPGSTILFGAFFSLFTFLLDLCIPVHHIVTCSRSRESERNRNLSSLEPMIDYRLAAFVLTLVALWWSSPVISGTGMGLGLTLAAIVYTNKRLSRPGVNDMRVRWNLCGAFVLPMLILAFYVYGIIAGTWLGARLVGEYRQNVHAAPPHHNASSASLLPSTLPSIVEASGAESTVGGDGGVHGVFMWMGTFVTMGSVTRGLARHGGALKIVGQAAMWLFLLWEACGVVNWSMSAWSMRKLIGRLVPNGKETTKRVSFGPDSLAQGLYQAATDLNLDADLRTQAGLNKGGGGSESGSESGSGREPTSCRSQLDWQVFVDSWVRGLFNTGSVALPLALTLKPRSANERPGRDEPVVLKEPMGAELWSRGPRPLLVASVRLGDNHKEHAGASACEKEYTCPIDTRELPVKVPVSLMLYLHNVMAMSMLSSPDARAQSASIVRGELELVVYARSSCCGDLRETCTKALAGRIGAVLCRGRACRSIRRRRWERVRLWRFNLDEEWSAKVEATLRMGYEAAAKWGRDGGDVQDGGEGGEGGEGGGGSNGSDGGGGGAKTREPTKLASNETAAQNASRSILQEGGKHPVSQTSSQTEDRNRLLELVEDEHFPSLDHVEAGLKFGARIFEAASEDLS